MRTGPGGIIPGSYDPTKLTQDQRNWLYNYFHPGQGNASVGYGGEHVSGDYGTNYVDNNGTYGPDSNAIAQAQQAQQQAKQQQFITSLNTAISGLPTPTQTYNSLADTLGITPTQTALTSAENNLNTIPQQTQQLATSMGGISSQQMNERNAVKSSELSPIVSSLANTLGIENQNLGTLFNAQEQQNQNTLLPFQYQAQFLGQNAQLAYNTWSQQDQEQFTQLMSKIQSNEQLTNEEAMAATNFSNQLQMYNQYPSLTGSSLMNPAILQALGGTLGTTGSGNTSINPLGLY